MMSGDRGSEMILLEEDDMAKAMEDEVAALAADGARDERDVPHPHDGGHNPYSAFNSFHASRHLDQVH